MSSRDGLTCAGARELLWPPEQPRLAEADVVGARSHVDGCEECQAYFAQDELLLSSYQRLRQEAAPRHVREHVFDALAGERARITGSRPTGSGRRPWAIWASVAAAAVLAVTSASLFQATPIPAADDGGTMFVQDYLRRAVGEDQITTGNADEVKRFLARELGQVLSPLEAEGLVLTRAEICLLEGRRGAMIMYDHEGETISHYLVPAEDGSDRAPARGEPLAAAGEGGALAVVTWSSPHLEQALVGAVPSDLLMSLARRSAD